MVAQVSITGQLATKLNSTSLTPSLLIQKFSEWKNGGEDSSYWFGRDSTDHITKLSHVHMIPVNPGQDKEKWNYLWERNRPWERRSDSHVI